MLRFVDISFHANDEYANAEELMDAQRVAMLYLEHLERHMQVLSVKHVAKGSITPGAYGRYHFFKGKNRFGYLSLRTTRFLVSSKPDVLFVNGLIFPLQVIILKALLGRRTKIILRHRADQPGNRIKKILQRFADRSVDAYFFNASGNAKEWLRQRIICDHSKIIELPGTLTSFKRLDKQECRRVLSMGQGLHFLWVGRLNENKDPVTALKGFKNFLQNEPEATLHFIFQEDELLPELLARLQCDEVLRSRVRLQGKVVSEELETWFSAADFLVLTSWSEGGSTVLIEAMACGCLPIVSAIPSNLHSIGHGTYGFSFPRGDAGALCVAMKQACNANRPVLSASVEAHYHAHYSPAHVAEKISAVCHELVGKEIADSRG